jgi:transcriptional regulator with XRE-family HTH domain
MRVWESDAFLRLPIRLVSVVLTALAHSCRPIDVGLAWRDDGGSAILSAIGELRVGTQNMDMTISSQYVRELRQKANWSQEDLAAASGLSLRTIQRVENDGAAAFETRKALAAAFGLRPDDLEKVDPAEDPYYVRIGLGLLVFWIGIAWLFNLGLGIGLLGVGAIYIGTQLWRVTIQRLRFMWEQVALGCVFLLAGSAALFGLEVRVGAILLIGAGCLMMFSRRKA